MGVRHANGVAGDLIAEVQVMLPKAIPPSLAESIRAASAGDGDPRGQLRW
jgi:hypothetical protein